VRLASRGQRDFDDGPETISDPIELAQVRRQARAVQIKSFLFTIAGTALAFAIAELLE
jgi:hypothetical protein